MPNFPNFSFLTPPPVGLPTPPDYDVPIVPSVLNKLGLLDMISPASLRRTRESYVNTNIGMPPDVQGRYFWPGVIFISKRLDPMSDVYDQTLGHEYTHKLLDANAPKLSSQIPLGVFERERVQGRMRQYYPPSQIPYELPSAITANNDYMTGLDPARNQELFSELLRLLPPDQQKRLLIYRNIAVKPKPKPQGE